MASKKKANSTKKPRAGGKSRKAKVEIGDGGDHVRVLAPERAVVAYMKEILAARLATSQEGQQLATATKRATEQGINVPAARSAARTAGMAQRDGLKARVYLEDYLYYLECFGFDKLAPKGMFTAEEGGQKRSRKPKQTEMELPEQEQPRSPVPVDGEGGEPLVTH